MKRLDIGEFLQSATGEEINICYYVVNSIKEYSFDEQVQKVKDFCELYGTIKSEKTFCIDKAISEQMYDDLKTQYGRYVDNLLNTVLNKAYLCEWTEEKFYSALWKSLTNGGVLETIEEWAFGLYFIVIDRKIPYFRLTLGLKMNQERYESIIEENKKVIKKMQYALSFPFDEKTEEASIILDELEAIPEKDARIVLLSVVISHLRKERDRAFSMLKELLDSD